jgi:hypothetical protein
VIPTPAKLRGPPTDWWTVTHNGVPVWHYPPDKRDLAERFATDPEGLEHRSYQLTTPYGLHVGCGQKKMRDPIDSGELIGRTPRRRAAGRC